MRDRNLQKHIRSHGVVSFCGKSKIAVPEVRIKTDISHSGFFPGEVRILDAGGLITTHLASTISAQNIIIRIKRSEMRIVTYLEITCLAITGAQFQIVEPSSCPIHEIFPGNSPCGGNGREETPAMILTKAGGTICTNSSGEHIFALVTILNTCQDRGQRPLICA